MDSSGCQEAPACSLDLGGEWVGGSRWIETVLAPALLGPGQAGFGRGCPWKGNISPVNFSSW